MNRVDTFKAEIYTIDGFLTASECQMLRECINTHATRSVVYQGTVEVLVESDERTSSTAKLKREYHPLINEINARISATLGIPQAFGEVMQGQRYEKDQEFISHTDYFKRKWYQWRKKPQRTWTFMIYLNEDCRGGETEFSFLKLIFKPKEGMAVVWRNLGSGGRPNPSTIHAGRPVTEGVKYIITKWFQDTRFQDHE